MSRQSQVDLLKRLLHYVETRTTAMADAPWRNDVSVYTRPERLGEEQRVLFRRMGVFQEALEQAGLAAVGGCLG